VPPVDWIHIPVPAIVEPEVFAAVQEQLQENRRHARQSQRGARYLLQGLLQCQHCGYAFYGKPLSPSARKGRPRAYAYYRCVGTDAYRFGGHRLCPNTQVRTDRLELAVWQEVCALLAHPERLAQEFTRRLHADGQGQRQERTALERQVGKLRQGLARLIDSYAEGLIDKQEFEPRVTRLRQRIAHVEAQCQQLAEAETLQRELQRIIGRVEEFAAQVQQNLEALEWHRQREILRALVRRVEIGVDQVQVVFRVDAFAGEADPEKKSLQLCKRSNRPPLRYPPGGWLWPAIGPDDASAQIAANQAQHAPVANARRQAIHQKAMVPRVKEALQVAVGGVPPTLAVGLCHLRKRPPRTAARTASVAVGAEVRLKERPDDLGDRLLHHSVEHGGNPQGARAPGGFGEHHPPYGCGAIGTPFKSRAYPLPGVTGELWKRGDRHTV
jgi:hypothetical protein